MVRKLVDELYVSRETSNVMQTFHQGLKETRQSAWAEEFSTINIPNVLLASIGDMPSWERCVLDRGDSQPVIERKDDQCAQMNRTQTGI